MTTTAITAPRTAATFQDDPNWWRQASVYQIYPRSFSDSNGDGIGDLNGITAKVPYLTELGVDAVWLSPFYPSALADGGYDVDDYRNVDPKLGTLEDFDAMAGALHAAGIKLIVDIVPNHSSDRHEWFREALAAPKGSAARDRYIFRDGLGENGELPPSDWNSVFGGPVWERITEPDGTPGQWYMHIFAKEQPDLNWDNQEVRDDFLTTLRFWSDRGVDGFRIDVAHALTKNLEGTLPSQADLDARGEALFLAGEHPYWDRNEVHGIYAEWRKVFNEYNPPRTAVAEAWVHVDRRARYASPEGLGQAFNFDLLQADFDAAQFRRTVTKNLAEAEASGASSTWVFSNHDVVRHATRYGLPATGSSAEGEIMAGQAGKRWLLEGGRQEDVNIELGLRRARAASLLMFALPGSAYLYQGEELGLQEVGVEIPDSERQDPSFFRNRGVEIGRDGCRVPLPWNTGGSSFGFGPGGSHLPQPEWFAGASVEAQEQRADSTLSLYRRALSLRWELQSAETLEWLETGREDVLAFRRPNGWTSVTNFGTEPFALPAGRLLVASSAVDGGELPGAATAWLQA
ncbi:alpha amylase catalytic region [Pseudarthrobacter chlorophenolicus A6]|uniref:Alpha amylase catalytic region n=1 Tax=Pseudarthrobacter chlorophenolicus (strain ATCC 700700 / DSM 12829 / CIP 107037 / JCM 12360 / KCTC 9906 / NCIMB 13794 / A6) TaxID=452863 RepID=B8H6N3_PSECP|nr:alpha-amylase family glycosyl hydrolase [Pseudarthrobacter chlorophenolicus]ACL41559.1 alpha amylase catalytic region [Pseudarthrobacter chlorophenolicus A6]SDQ62104.1 alpha-glucosidase [Pseudarthrobacter chlorophenolicus]